MIWSSGGKLRDFNTLETHEARLGGVVAEQRDGLPGLTAAWGGEVPLLFKEILFFFLFCFKWISC